MSKAVWFTVHQSALQQAFTSVIGAVESKKDIPILSHVFFEVTGETLLLRGTNLDLQIDAECETLKVEEEMRFALPADRLKGIMSNLPENAEVSFGPGRASDQVMVYAGAAKLSVSFLPADDFPVLPEVEGEWTDINGAALAQALAKVQHAIDKSDSSRIYLTGFCLHRPDDGDGIVVAGTDGKNLARVATASGGCPDFPEMRDSFPHIILPVRSAESIRKLADGATKDCRVRCGRSRISVTHAGVTVTSKLIDGTYPPYWRVIPETGSDRLNLKLEALSASIRRINVMIDDAGADAMRVKAGGGVIDLDMVGIRGSFAHDRLPAVTEVPAGFEIGLNGAQLQKMLAAISGSEIDIFVVVGDDKSPILVKPVGASNETYVLVPMRPRLTPEASE